MELEISATGPFQALLYMCFKKKNQHELYSMVYVEQCPVLLFGNNLDNRTLSKSAPVTYNKSSHPC